MDRCKKSLFNQFRKPDAHGGSDALRRIGPLPGNGQEVDHLVKWSQAPDGSHYGETASGGRYLQV